MAREGARQLLVADGEVDLDALDDIFRAFGFTSEFQAPSDTVYYHPEFINCGVYLAREYRGAILSFGQKRLVLSMVDCIVFRERRSRRV